MPSRGPDPWAYERQALARRRRRRRRQRRMLWVLTWATTVVLLVIAWMIREIAPVPTVATTAALSASARPSGGTSVRPALRGDARATGKARPSASPSPRYPRVTDGTSGLSYRALPRPWRSGCPSVLQTPIFSWSAGENAVAGHVIIGGSLIDWHANACSGQLQQQFAYAGPADLQTTAMSLVGALDPAYYSGVQHYLTVQGSSSTLVSGNQAWVARFEVAYPDGAGQGVTWSRELGAVVVVDRGPGDVPSVFYVSVPDNVGTSDVGALLRSLRMGHG